MANPTYTAVHIDRAMTNVSIAYKNSAYIADQLFPSVPVQNQSDKYFVYTKSDWFRDEAGPRTPGTLGPQADFRVSSSSYSCQSVSMTKLLPDEVLQNADAPLNMRRSAVEFATQKVMISVERDVAGLVFDNGSWSASATPGTTWDKDSSSPLEDIETGREAIVKSIGYEPNVLVLGREVWTYLKNHPDLLDRIKYTQRGIMTVDLMASLFDVKKVLVGNAVYDSANQGATSSHGFIWGKNAALLWVPPAPSLMTPAAGYTFNWKKRTVESHRRGEAKATAYRVEQNYDTKVVSPDAGYEFIDAVV